VWSVSKSQSPSTAPSSQNLERDPSLGRKHAVYDEMRAKGLTDYVAWPLYHTLGKRHIVTFATDRPGGFDDAHIAGLLKLLPVLALVSEIRIKNRLARTLLETYVGSHAGELILAGATRRGSGTTVRAAIMICDLRDFTRISDNWPRDDVIDLLNGYFDAMSEPIARHGGEILKFIVQGGPISPVLSNIYLHFTLDLWFEKKFKAQCLGEAYLVRFADDFVGSFQFRGDAQNFQRQLRERFAQFNLELAEEKTRLLLFGRFAAIERRKHGQRPETFEFLGFKHVCGEDRAGRFALIRIPCTKSCRKFLARAREWLLGHRHWKRRQQQQHLTVMLRGFYQSFAFASGA
jgi:hypothetical protein